MLVQEWIKLWNQSLYPPMMHPQAIEDDLIPLSKPVRTKYGELVDSLTIVKGMAAC
ncbi:hypothetical protein L210DRAFT_3581285 [Boletus edulis BED1]|uniref:Uncharacterized protein n=1 Tax=Boletus edulis BED1 TaxID=1328754 RepID=A0AAD4BCB0_BOLED|nr:hypothetical protein L210DRAFT_3581285 [Boletus edulis BED1]